MTTRETIDLSNLLKRANKDFDEMSSKKEFEWLNKFIKSIENQTLQLNEKFQLKWALELNAQIDK